MMFEASTPVAAALASPQPRFHPAPPQFQIEEKTEKPDEKETPEQIASSSSDPIEDKLEDDGYIKVTKIPYFYIFLPSLFHTPC